MSILHSDLSLLVISKFYDEVDVDYDAVDVDNGNATLDDRDNPNMLVHLTEIPANAFVFKCEKNRENIFNTIVHGNRTRQICDYFMIINDPSHLELFFFELKETQNPENLKVASRQIKSSIPLLRYIVSGLEVHCGYRYQLPKKIWQEHYVALFNQTNDKISPHQRGAPRWFSESIENLPEACACIVNRPLSLGEIRSKSKDAKKRAKPIH